MDSSGASGSSILGGVVVALVTVWFLWDLFFAGVDLLALGTGVARPIAALVLLSSVLYSTYRYRRYRQRGY